MWSWCAKRAARRCRQSFWTDPLVYQGGSDDFLGARQDVPLPSEEHGIDLEGEVAVITDDVPMGTQARSQPASTSSW